MKYKIAEQKRFDSITLVTIVEYTPNANEAQLVGAGKHTNKFISQISETGRRIKRDSQGRFLTKNGLAIDLKSNRNFMPDQNDAWNKENFVRNVLREMDKNIRNYWQRKVDAAEKGNPYPRFHNTTINLQVTADTDDTEDSNTASGTLNTDNKIGQRFLSVTIPAGVTIDSAVLVWTPTANDDDNDDNMSLRCEDEDDPATYGDTNGRTYTTATSDDFFFGAVTADVEESSPSLVDTVQEVVDRGGWASGQAMAVALDKEQSQANNTGFYSHNNDTSKAPKLDIDYTAAAAINPDKWHPKANIPLPEKRGVVSY